MSDDQNSVEQKNEPFLQTINLIKKDKAITCTIAICLTIIICTGMISKQLSSIYRAIPDNSSYEVNNTDYSTILSDIKNNLDEITINTHKIETNTMR